MKVAIMGAGLSGLTAAVILEQQGIIPDIYEKESHVSNGLQVGELFLSILSKPNIPDALHYLGEEYGVYLKPIANISKLIVQSPNERAIITGEIGFSTLRGTAKESLESQLHKMIRTEIHFKSQKSYTDLSNQYTHVLLATGDPSYTQEIQEFAIDVPVTLRGATVCGEFNPHTAGAWLDHSFAPGGYGYLIPFSDKEANLAIGYPDYPKNQGLETDLLWNRCLQRVSQDLNQDLKEKNPFQITRYLIGRSKSARIGNTLFLGNCFGSIMPFLGFGQLAAILTGIYAAQDICGLGDYEELTEQLRHSYDNSLALRRSLEKMSDSQLDLVVKGLRTVGNRLFSTKRVAVLRLAAHLLKPFS